MTYFSQARELVASAVAEWQAVRLAELQFWHRGDVRVVLAAAIAVLLVLLFVRTVLRRRPGRHQIVLPALPRSIRGSRGSFLTHVPLLCFLVGLPFFILALGDPHTALIGQDVSYPGRRVALLIDASISMLTPFTSETLIASNPKLNARNTRQPTFYSTVAAAQKFIEMRAKSRNRDLMALIEFGDEAYVVTPFTSDYDNIMLSVSLIGDPVEFGMFPDRGTLIGQAIQQAIELFKAFKFLDATGNMLVIFTDGEDAHTSVNGIGVDDIMQMAVDVKIPVYFVRTNYGKDEGQLVPDGIWKPAIAKTGGRFFAASDENALIEAINEIDQVTGDTIQVRQYTSQQPRFAIFASIALTCWAVAALLKLTMPYFQRLP